MGTRKKAMAAGAFGIIFAISIVGQVFLRAEINFPWKDTYIGSLDGKGWCGLVLAPQKDSAFAFRFKIEKDGRTADGDDFFYMVSEVGPNAPDGLYARVKFDLGLPILPADQKSETPILIKPQKNPTRLFSNGPVRTSGRSSAASKARRTSKSISSNIFPGTSKAATGCFRTARSRGNRARPKPSAACSGRTAQGSRRRRRRRGISCLFPRRRTAHLFRRRDRRGPGKIEKTYLPL